MIIGILGGGQLARMLALAGHPLGLKFIILDPAENVCASAVSDQIVGDYDDKARLAELADQVDLVTYEFENVPMESAAFLLDHAPVFPGPQALAAAQDRLTEKTLLRQLGIPVPDFAVVDNQQDLQAAVAQIGLPAILKTRRMGYDGKGQVILHKETDLEEGYASMQGAPAILEGFVPFDREVSIIAVRSRHGLIKFYPLSENTHRDGILRLSLSRSGDSMQTRAEQYVTRILQDLDYVGVIALELFQVGDQLLANEFAPRVHNSGHWTLEGAETSQFENHLRAVAGLPLGSTEAIGAAAMVNFIGAVPDPEAVLTLPNAHLHAYDKAFRAGRKVGHATIRTNHVDQLDRLMQPLIELADRAEKELG